MYISKRRKGIFDSKTIHDKRPMIQRHVVYRLMYYSNIIDKLLSRFSYLQSSVSCIIFSSFRPFLFVAQFCYNAHVIPSLIVSEW